MAASFLFTYDSQATQTPQAARDLLRANRLTFAKAMTHTPDLVQTLKLGWISFPDDAVLLMIGRTQELLDELSAVWRGGITTISGNKLSLECFGARIAVSLTHTHTVLAISAEGSRAYTTTAGRAWEPPPGLRGRIHGTLSLDPNVNDGQSPAQTDRLSRIITSCLNMTKVVKNL
jgi:hypothetical protein